MDGSILVVAAPSLRADLHASGAELQLVVTMYTLALNALIVTVRGSGTSLVSGERSCMA
jgi:hypothetical protein